MTLRTLKTSFCKETQDWSEAYRNMCVSEVIPVMDIEDRLRVVEERLLIVNPPAGKFTMYPALAEAYKEYKLIEKLTLGNNET